MPYKSEKIIIAGTEFDKRIKLSAEQKRAIKILSKENYSQRKLAKMFGCSRRSVQNILTPQERPKNVKAKPTEYWTEQKRIYRKRKQELFLAGKIKEK